MSFLRQATLGNSRVDEAKNTLLDQGQDLNAVIASEGLVALLELDHCLVVEVDGHVDVGFDRALEDFSFGASTRVLLSFSPAS